MDKWRGRTVLKKEYRNSTIKVQLSEFRFVRKKLEVLAGQKKSKIKRNKYVEKRIWNNNKISLTFLFEKKEVKNTVVAMYCFRYFTPCSITEWYCVCIAGPTEYNVPFKFAVFSHQALHPGKSCRRATSNAGHFRLEVDNSAVANAGREIVDIL